MHSYLRSIGFSQLSKAELNKILDDVVKHYDEKTVVESHPDHLFAEFSRNYGCDCGITVCGEYDENENFQTEYYYPFFRGAGITTQESVVVEQHAEKESFAGACDDMRIGVTLIFYLQKAAEYMNAAHKGLMNAKGQPLTLSGLAREGVILLPIQKNSDQEKTDQEITTTRNRLIAAARNGDEEAMESLTMEDIDTYTMVSRRIQNEDVFSIVDSYFMPFGMECDQYNVLGEIIDFFQFPNIISGEKLYQLTVKSNDMQFDICINAKDLTGEPAIGRRFKGIIWLQGQLHF